MTASDVEVLERLKSDAEYRGMLAGLIGQNAAGMEDVSESVLLHFLFTAGIEALRERDQEAGYALLAQQYGSERRAQRRVPAWADEQ